MNIIYIINIFLQEHEKYVQNNSTSYILSNSFCVIINNITIHLTNNG